MIQDIQPYAFDNTFRHKTPDAHSQILHIRDNAVLIRETEEGIAFPAYGELAPPDAPCTYLFSIDDTSFFLALPADPQGDYAYAALMEFRGKKPRHLAYAAAVGCQLYDWYSKNRFCGRCSAPMAHDGKERMMRCPRCDNMVFPRISPAVIVGIINGDRILLTRYSGRLYRRYALVAGFAEIGETIEETVQREVMEEVGLRVKNLCYYKSQPWPFSGSLLMGFFCELDGPDIIRLDENELECAEWVNRGDIHVELDGISLTNEMIVRFKEQ